MTWQEDYLARFYNPADGWVNGTLEFHNLCASAIPHGGPKGGKILENRLRPHQRHLPVPRDPGRAPRPRPRP